MEELQQNEQPEISTTRVGLRYGLMVGLASIIYSTLLQITGMAMVTGLQWLGGVITIAGMVLAMKYYKEHTGGFMSFSQGLGIGTIMAAVAGVVSSIFTFIYLRFIDDSMITTTMEKAREDLEKQGLGDEQIDQAMEMTGMFMTPEVMFITGIIGSIFIGFLIALLVSAIMQNKKPEFD